MGMYAPYYGLTESAFSKTPDPKYLFESDVYEEAILQLLYAVQEREFGIVVGPAGSGKTLLTRVLLDRLGDGYEVGLIVNPRLTPMQFLETAAVELGVSRPAQRKSALMFQIQDRLLSLEESGRPAVLIVDEAHLVPTREIFEEIRLLANIQLDDRNLLAVLLVGQPELKARLKRKCYAPLVQRFGAQLELRPLCGEETARYLEHRLRVAGSRWQLFTKQAVASLHEAAHGLPRSINNLATLCLIEAMADGHTMVNEKNVSNAVESLLFPA